MSPKVSAIAWVSKGRTPLLERSVSGFRSAIKREGMNLPLFVAGTTLDPLDSVDKQGLCDRLIDRTKDRGIPAGVIRFALIGTAGIETLSVIDIGANRNALLLKLINQVFLSVDDDVLCRFAIIQDPANEEVVLDPKMELLSSTFFLDAAECERAVEYPEESQLGDFLSAHEELLGGEHRVAATVSGIHGDSGYGSPRLLLTLPEADKRSLLSRAGLYEAAIKNRLILRNVAAPVVSDSPLFMAMCAGFDNRMCLPPFFPFGRNEDGVFGSAIKACLPNLRIGYVPWVVRHVPLPAREYPDGEVQIWRFRISELINLLLEAFYQSCTGKSDAAEFERYELAGQYLEEFARQSPAMFMAALRNLCTPNLEVYVGYLHKLAASSRTEPFSWVNDVRLCASNIEAIKKQETYCIPEELLRAGNINEAIDLARSLVLKYGTLLRCWRAIREAARE